MWPRREGYDEPEPNGYPGSARVMYIGWPVNRLPHETESEREQNNSVPRVDETSNN